MKFVDALGRELKVGDIVAYGGNGTISHLTFAVIFVLRIGKVNGYDAQKFIVKWVSDYRKEINVYESGQIQEPERCVIIDESVLPDTPKFNKLREIAAELRGK